MELSTFRFSDMRSVSKNRFIGAIHKEDHYMINIDGRDTHLSRPRKLEYIFSSFGRFMIVDKINDVFPHKLVIQKLTKESKPKIKGVDYLPLVVGSESFYQNLIVHKQ